MLSNGQTDLTTEKHKRTLPKKSGASHLSQLERLKKIEGQVRGVAKMVEENRYCVDILTQVRAVIAGMKAVEANIADQHLRHCIESAVKSNDSATVQEALAEVSALLRRGSR